jgi:Flp pilus assembly pilin Flp
MNFKRDIHRFLKEESGQASIEYILIVGAVMVAAVMLAYSYRKMSYSSIYTMNISTQETLNTLCGYIAENLDVTNVTDFCPGLIKP